MFKYIMKFLVDKFDMLGVYIYYYSCGFGWFQFVGFFYWQNIFFDGLFKYENFYYVFFFCKFDSFCVVVSMCDEVDLMEDDNLYQ